MFLTGPWWGFSGSSRQNFRIAIGPTPTSPAQLGQHIFTNEPSYRREPALVRAIEAGHDNEGLQQEQDLYPRADRRAEEMRNRPHRTSSVR
jgi:hypothetical protein